MMMPRQFSMKIVLATAVALATFVRGIPAARALEIKRSTLSNGAVLLVSEEHTLPMVTVQIAFDAGSRRDPKGKEGLATLTAESLTQGTRSLQATDFNQKVDFMGSSISVSAGRDYAIAGLTSLKKYQANTLALFSAILNDPGLRDSDIERKRQEQIGSIKAQEETPHYAGVVKFTRALYGDAPYGHPAAGFGDTVAKLTPDDVREFYRDHYKLGSAVIAVAGDITADEAKSQIEKALTGLKGTVAPQTAPPAPTVAPGLHVDVIDRNIVQANVFIGFGGVERSNPDYYRLQVMNYILGGGGFASRLMKSVRVKQGLAYSIGSVFDAGKFPGAFSVMLETRNERANEAIGMVLSQMRQIQEQPVSDAEMMTAKKYLVGSFPLKFDTQGAIAGFMIQVEIYGLGLDYADRYPQLIQTVTRDDVLKVAKEYLHPDATLIVAVANKQAANIDAAKFDAPAPAAAAPSSPAP